MNLKFALAALAGSFIAVKGGSEGQVVSSMPKLDLSNIEAALRGNGRHLAVCPNYQTVSSSCCIGECGLACSSGTYCYLTLNECECRIGSGGTLGDSLDFTIYDSTDMAIIYAAVLAVNLLIAVAIVFCCIFPSLRKQEAHLPQELQIVDRKKCLAISLSFCFGVIGALIAYFLIKGEISTNNNNFMMRGGQVAPAQVYPAKLG